MCRLGRRWLAAIRGYQASIRRDVIVVIKCKTKSECKSRRQEKQQQSTVDVFKVEADAGSRRMAAAVAPLGNLAPDDATRSWRGTAGGGGGRQCKQPKWQAQGLHWPEKRGDEARGEAGATTRHKDDYSSTEFA